MMKNNCENRWLPTTLKNDVFEKIWNNELNRWSDFIDKIKKDPTLKSYRGYNIVHDNISSDNSRLRLCISISQKINIEFGYNPRAEFINYYYIYGNYESNNIASITKYLNSETFNRYAVQLDFIYFNDELENVPSRLLNSSTLLEMLLINTFFNAKLHPDLYPYANEIPDLLKRLEKEFGVELTEYEKNSINDLDWVIEQNERIYKEFLDELEIDKKD